MLLAQYKIKLKEEKRKMKTLKNKTAAIAIAIFLMLSMTASIILLPTTSAHTPAWQIPTYAYISAEPDTIGVGQTITVYIWLGPVYGASGGTGATVGTSGFTASAALTSNSYRFLNYKLTTTAPDGTVSTQNWAICSDPTSCVFATFTPTQVGTYNLTFTYPGQVYGAGGNGYSGSSLINDTYLPSSASTTVTVQQEPIPSVVNSAPMPTAYWTRPIYGEATDWWAISSNWLGTGQPPIAGYTSSAVYHGDSVGSLTAHVMWTLPMSAGGVVGGNEYAGGTANPGVGYFEGSCYIGRFSNPIVVDGYLYYKGVVGFSGGVLDHSTALTCKQDNLFGLRILYLRYHSLTYTTFGTANSTEFFNQYYSQPTLPKLLMDGQEPHCST